MDDTSHSALSLQSGEKADDRMESENTEVLTTGGKMPVYGIAFVSRHSSDIAPPGVAGKMCSGR